MSSLEVHVEVRSNRYVWQIQQGWKSQVWNEPVLLCDRLVWGECALLLQTTSSSNVERCTHNTQTTDLYCVNGDPQGNTLPCQKDFGSCEVKKGRTCGLGSGTANGRTIGYYQGSNTRDRLCNKITPQEIDSTGYTHLYYAFASIDPSSYAIIPGNAADPALYKDFTALKSRGLQTWIAVGGYDFSDVGSTHETWYVLEPCA